MPDFSMLVVSDKPCCFWYPDIDKTNLEFINGIDPLYYKYIADVNRKELQSESQYAAISTRIAYCHGLETLFSLLCACIQAPDCIVGWLLKYRMNQLRDLVKAIVNQQGAILNKHSLEAVTFENLSDLINQFNLENQDEVLRLKQSFASAWQRFAKDFLDDNIIAEYNSMKHGLRVSPGGYSLTAIPEVKPGVPNPSGQMIDFGGSVFGSSFFNCEAIKNRKGSQNSIHFMSKRHSLNWDPEYLLRGLYLISMSLNNILSFLKVFNGLSEDVKLLYPEDESLFRVPVDSNNRTMNIVSNPLIYEENIVPFSKDDILKVYEQ